MLLATSSDLNSGFRGKRIQFLLYHVCEKINFILMFTLSRLQEKVAMTVQILYSLIIRVDTIFFASILI